MRRSSCASLICTSYLWLCFFVSTHNAFIEKLILKSYELLEVVFMKLVIANVRLYRHVQLLGPVLAPPTIYLDLGLASNWLQCEYRQCTPLQYGVRSWAGREPVPGCCLYLLRHVLVIPLQATIVVF